VSHDPSREVLQALEPEQRTSALHAPLPRKRLGPGTLALLWMLRIYVLIAVPLVVYAFVRTL
jgi:hypothetical protein